jgi:peroxiredoxin Q/BCP
MKETGPSIRQFNVAYFAASVDEPQKNKEFAESLELDFPILSDPGRAVAKAYGVVSDDTRGASRWTFYIGPDGRILYIDKQVKTATHGQDIAARLKELGVPSSH